jgi:glycosyltransferase involved in cell wall biosynthesis
MIGECLFWIGGSLLFAIYPGYAAWAWYRASILWKGSPEERTPDNGLPTITCVLIVFNEERRLSQKIAAIEAQDYPHSRIKVIAVSDGSTDATDSILTAWSERESRVLFRRVPQRGGKPAAINLARALVASDVVVMMDARQGLNREAFRALVGCLRDPTVRVASACLTVRGDAYWSYETHLTRNESRSGSMVQATGSLYALRAMDLPEIPVCTILDDVYIPLRAIQNGGRIIMAESALSIDTLGDPGRREFARTVRTLGGLVQICHLLSGCLSSKKNPVATRFFIHKVARLICPYALLMMLLGALLGQGWIYRTSLVGAGTLMFLATLHSLGWQNRFTVASKLFLTLHLAALWAVPAYYLGRLEVTWAKSSD